MLTFQTDADVPLSIETDTEKFEEFKRGYAPGAVAAASVTPIVLTGAGQLATWFAAGIAPGQRLGFGACWALALLTIPLLQLSRLAVLREGKPRVPQVYWMLSLVQNTWLAMLAWYAVPAYAPVLLFVLCLILFNDARYFYNAPAVKAAYGAMWITQPLLLLLVDAFGSEGLLHALRARPQHAAIMLIGEACVAMLSLVIIQFAGKGQYERDLAFRKSARLEAALQSMKTERSVLARSCDFLLQGLTAGRFSHDVASPISVVNLEVVRLREMLAPSIGGQLESRVARCLERIETAADRTRALTSSLARSLREPSEPVSVRAAELVAEAILSASMSLKRHAIEMLEPRVELDDGSLVITREHAAAIGNVLVNGVLQQRDRPIDIFGRSASDYFYRLAIRDWGVLPQERSQALQRVEAHMSLLVDNATTAGLREYDGYGIGLLLTKALVVRGGGWMHAIAPEEGAGLCFEFMLPKVAPQTIPDEFNTPERLLGAGRALTS